MGRGAHMLGNTACVRLASKESGKAVRVPKLGSNGVCGMYGKTRSEAIAWSTRLFVAICTCGGAAMIRGTCVSADMIECLPHLE